MRWSDLDRHDRFGFAEIDRRTRRVIRCTSSFARMVGVDQRLIAGSDLSHYSSEECRDLFTEGLVRVCDGMKEFVSVSLCFHDGHCVAELNLLKESNVVFVVASRSGEHDRQLLAERFDRLQDKFIEFADMTVRVRPDWDLSITQINGGQNVVEKRKGGKDVSDEINIGGVDRVEVNGGQNVIGKNDGGMHQSGAAASKPIEVDDVLEVMLDPKVLPADVADRVVPRIRGFSSLPADDQLAIVEGGETSPWSSVIASIAPYADEIMTSLAVFGTAALETLASKSPVIAGILAVCKRYSGS